MNALGIIWEPTISVVSFFVVIYKLLWLVLDFISNCSWNFLGGILFCKNDRFNMWSDILLLYMPIFWVYSWGLWL